MFVVGRGLPLFFAYLSKIADSQSSIKQQLNIGWLLDRGSSEICIWCRRLLPEKKKKITNYHTHLNDNGIRSLR